VSRRLSALLEPESRLYLTSRGLRALRNAEQGSPGDFLWEWIPKPEVVAMAKQMLSWARRLAPAALAVAGWIAFVGGICSQVLWLKIVLLSVARVLPPALCF